MNLRPFNLEEALAGKPVVTRTGKPVILAGYNPNVNENAKLAGWIGDIVKAWREDGSYIPTASDLDLFMAPLAREHWCIFVQNKISKQYLWLEKTHPSQKEAESFLKDNNLCSIYKLIKTELSYTEEL